MKRLHSDDENDEISDSDQESLMHLQKKAKLINDIQSSRWLQMLERYSFDERIEKAAASGSETHILQVLRDFIEIELGSPLKYYFIKSYSSCIKRDGKYPYWTNLLDEELNILTEQMSEKYILKYVDNIVPAFNHKSLIDKIENDHRSKLKSYIQMRNNKIKSEKECRSLIEREWKLLEANIPEEFICAYYVIFFGNPLST